MPRGDGGLGRLLGGAIEVAVLSSEEVGEGSGFSERDSMIVTGASKEFGTKSSLVQIIRAFTEDTRLKQDRRRRGIIAASRCVAE